MSPNLESVSRVVRAARLAAAVLAGLSLACALARHPPELDDLALEEWVELGSARFSIASGAGPERTLELARQLEVFGAVVARTSSLDRMPRLPARIYLFPDYPEYALFRPQRWAGGHMAATPRGFFMVMSADSSATRSLLFHEFVHYLVYNDSALHYPIWYQEGLAELLSTLRIREHRITLGAAPQGAIAAMARRPPLPSRTFFATRRYSDLRRKEVGHFYLQSWALVHFFHAGHHLGFPRRLAQMRDCLARLDRGEAWEPAFAASFGITPEELDVELGSYWERLAGGSYIPKIVLDARRLGLASELSESDLSPLPPAQVAAELGELYLDHGEEAADWAAGLLDRALAADPDHVGALAGRARASAWRGDFEAAGRDLEHVRALAPDDAGVLRARGDVHLARAAGEETDRKQLEAAREAYRRSIESDPRLPAGYVALGRTYLDEEDDDPAPGIEALRAAHGALPWSVGLDMDLARLYARAGRADDARRHLAEVLRWSHSDELREEAEGLLRELDADGEGAPGRPPG